MAAFQRELRTNPNDFQANLRLGLLLRDENRLDEASDYLTRAARLRPKRPRRALRPRAHPAWAGTTCAAAQKTPRGARRLGPRVRGRARAARDRLLPARAQGGRRPRARDRREAQGRAQAEGDRAEEPAARPAGTDRESRSRGPALADRADARGRPLPRRARPRSRRSPPAPAPQRAEAQAKAAERREAGASAEFDALAKRAQAAHEAQKLDEALELYQKALRLRPRWSEGRFALGTVLYDLDRYEEARAEFRQVLVQEPKSGRGLGLPGDVRVPAAQPRASPFRPAEGPRARPRRQPAPASPSPTTTPASCSCASASTRPLARSSATSPSSTRTAPASSRASASRRCACRTCPRRCRRTSARWCAIAGRAILPVHQEPLLPHRAAGVRRARRPASPKSRTPTTRRAPSS